MRIFSSGLYEYFFAISVGALGIYILIIKAILKTKELIDAFRESAKATRYILIAVVVFILGALSILFYYVLLV